MLFVDFLADKLTLPASESNLFYYKRGVYLANVNGLCLDHASICYNRLVYSIISNQIVQTMETKKRFASGKREREREK